MAVNVLLRAWALVLAVLWSVPGFGVIDLLFSWNPEWPVMVEAGWGLFVSFGLTLPLLVVVVSPPRAGAALRHLVVAAAALVAAVVVGRETEAWWMLLVTAVSVATVFALARRVPPAPAPLGGRSPALVALAAVAVPFALAYAWQTTTAGWDGPPADITNDVDHYVIQAALALVVPALVLLAAVWPANRRLSGTAAALMAGYSGLVSWSFPGTLAGWPAWVSAAAMAWAVVALALAWWPARVREPAANA